MADERYGFAEARERLEEIVTQVRKKDVSLEQSLDLLEEGVRLANLCTELSDHTEWQKVADERSETVADESMVPVEVVRVETGASGPDEEVPVTSEDTVVTPGEVTVEEDVADG